MLCSRVWCRCWAQFSRGLPENEQESIVDDRHSEPVATPDPVTDCGNQQERTFVNEQYAPLGTPDAASGNPRLNHPESLYAYVKFMSLFDTGDPGGFQHTKAKPPSAPSLLRSSTRLRQLIMGNITQMITTLDEFITHQNPLYLKSFAGEEKTYTEAHHGAIKPHGHILTKMKIDILWFTQLLPYLSNPAKKIVDLCLLNLSNTPKALSGYPVVPDEQGFEETANNSAWAREGMTCDGDDLDPSRDPDPRDITASAAQSSPMTVTLILSQTSQYVPFGTSITQPAKRRHSNSNPASPCAVRSIKKAAKTSYLGPSPGLESINPTRFESRGTQHEENDDELGNIGDVIEQDALDAHEARLLDATSRLRTLVDKRANLSTKYYHLLPSGTLSRMD
ncbi:hypothetical protein BKA59DRAFT_460284 [Fusarium tricinctum]|uniref:Uncharacterized protein n=1 Tax=Fusarium tricinctum TaxID=61284 RepID=A0A8K0RMH2_9HYPO|nr:hypothetical protein BKA59DRAFT_460284 [Fusarium tricinctum]